MKRITPGMTWLLFWWFCIGNTLGEAPPAITSPGLDASRLAEMAAAVEESIGRKECPGAVLWVEHAGLHHQRSLGRRAVEPKAEPMTLNTIFDAASLTKVVATTPAVMMLVERGRVDPEAFVSRYLEGFVGEGREHIRVRHLLTHTSGLRPGIPRQPPWSGRESALELAFREKPDPMPDQLFRYSDINFILLGEIVTRVSGLPMERFVERELFRPLRMNDTRYLPLKRDHRRVAPTEKVAGQMLRGKVHDPTCRLMGGVAGHAGLFTTASDLARFARMMINEGELEGARVLRPETVRRMTSVQTPAGMEARRGWGWDIDTGYSRPRGRLFPIGSYGHTGFTGTCLWIDPFSKTFWMLLSNRVHPDGKGNILPLQLELGTLAAQSVTGFDFESVPGALAPRPSSTPTSRATTHPPPVLNGIDVWVRDGFKEVQGMKVGLICNHTAHDYRRRSTIDLLARAPGVQLRALFSPEHGIRGEADEKIGDGRDARTGLPIYSLYGERREPLPSQLEGLDVLVFDIQDIGARYYTYMATLGNCMAVAAKAGVRFIVLDRVNPINGLGVEGPVHTNSSTFVAYHRIPIRHGMTIGELAMMFREERGWNLDLRVVRMEGWNRSMWFDETGLSWTHPSPNMRSLAGAALYPALGFHEAALAVGRGTDSPFQWIGAPYADGVRVAAELRRAGLHGVRFIPIEFTPTYSTFKGRRCGGVAITIVDREAFSAVDLGIELALVFQRLYPREFALDRLKPLLTDESTIAGIRSGRTLADIRLGWAGELTRFKERRARHLLYP